MIRPFTLMSFLLAGVAGYGLYQQKQRTMTLDRQIEHVIQATRATREQTGMLRAEWALLNEPGRLQDLAGRYLQLKPMVPSQFVRLADLANHLPPVPQSAPANPAAGTDEDATGAAAPARAAPQNQQPASQLPGSQLMVQADPAGGQAEGAGDEAAARRETLDDAHGDDGRGAPTSLRSADAAAPLATAAPPAPRPARLPHGAGSTRARRQYAARELHPWMMRGTPLPLAAPRPVGATVLSAMAHPMRPVIAARPVVSTVQALGPAPVLGSALGGAYGGRSMLPPPVPLGAEGQ